MQQDVHPLRSSLVRVNGVTLHYIRAGRGPTLLLLHGWPEFCQTWAPLMHRLAARGFDVIAPDLRGFGDSDNPNTEPCDTVGEAIHASDMTHLLDELEIETCGLVGHDIGAVVGQSLGRAIPNRLSGLFFFDCPYPGIAARWADPAQIGELWHFSFHQMPWAAAVVGASRRSCELYIGHFLSHWCARKDAFDDVRDAWVNNFLKPGNLQGGFNWYISRRAAREANVSGTAATETPITVPACVRWGALDPALPVAWADRLGETFSDLDFAPFEGAGHFPHREYPERAASEIAAFFGMRGAGRC
jgi:pimeloyl-ACP methyl ester carboxylesterase